MSHPAVAEAAVAVGADETRGLAIVSGDAIVYELRNDVGKEIGPIAKPKIFLMVPRTTQDPFRQDPAPFARGRCRGSEAVDATIYCVRKPSEDAAVARRIRTGCGTYTYSPGLDEFENGVALWGVPQSVKRRK